MKLFEAHDAHFSSSSSPASTNWTLTENKSESVLANFAAPINIASSVRNYSSVKGLQLAFDVATGAFIFSTFFL
jgi:hypothetical protein